MKPIKLTFPPGVRLNEALPENPEVMQIEIKELDKLKNRIDKLELENTGLLKIISDIRNEVKYWQQRSI